jgi:hypothetical protein
MQISYPSTPNALALSDRIFNRLARRRRELGINQNALDNHIGCADSLVTKWVCRVRRPSARNLACWMAALEFEVVVTPLE